MISYKDSGVDIDEGNALVEGLKPLVTSTFDKNVIGGIGSFAGAYALPSGYKNPVILGATDGVGTKLRLAIDAQKFDSIGIDLVAMCVNDLICNFAMPMFFLDYYATGKLNKDIALKVISGIVEGCKQAQCALIGGESAEMPSMYAKDDFDLAGFAVGIAERDEVQLQRVQAGDILIALPSSGIHSNGYSLVRKVLFEKLKMSFDEIFEGQTLIDTLLTPTRIYTPLFKQIYNSALRPYLHGLAHITGGGIVENLPRILPPQLGAKIHIDSLQVPPIFTLIGQYVEKNEMYRTFNMGVGMILAVNKTKVDEMLHLSHTFHGYIIGEVCGGEGIYFN
ncbi:phosphoribosylformylglycinamidine cyclo-ligase [Helicobacter sp. MIT 21-1697]|uniref:phosphoribosylformylglycinamidine cyclo-ligase n=1 Tax=Helicobacter sp. MIT 21-1697 TaxID=2993733 RepID=UPI00224B6FD2|nr:phosphoribosylformylglycinamidine cyclo-ligase [Helicobacter sp. MIT 21-1697]MCX2717145.1 phosphoribosylformylglycinamidine cyclo-ligase [Helicobacter sp. MIT 21-1697]